MDILPNLKNTTLLPECPPISSLKKTIPDKPLPDIILSTKERTLGTIVEVTCHEGYHVIGKDTLKCLKTSEWDTETQPYCSDVTYGIPESTRLYIGVFVGCGALVLFALTIIIAKLICFRIRRSSSGSADQFPMGTESVTSVEYYADDKRYRVPATIQLDTKYDDGGNFETFANPTFYDEEADRWRNTRHSSYDSSFDCEPEWQQYPEVTYENGRKWSINGIRAVENYDYDRYGRIPRAKSPEAEVVDDDRTPF